MSKNTEVSSTELPSKIKGKRVKSPLTVVVDSNSTPTEASEGKNKVVRTKKGKLPNKDFVTQPQKKSDRFNKPPLKGTRCSKRTKKAPGRWWLAQGDMDSE